MGISKLLSGFGLLNVFCAQLLCQYMKVLDHGV